MNITLVIIITNVIHCKLLLLQQHDCGCDAVWTERVLRFEVESS